ncbi:sodium- and chloride-dependent GABA transporter 1 isoform X1 [Pocillopora verrucosa]|uniref:sodium- and chloride-dependent GABA transporter 1 isoform X1 n=2 Tax=Pocillopora verrucosa TaxID=203993 RepID=UPI00333F0B2F
MDEKKSFNENGAATRHENGDRKKEDMEDDEKKVALNGAAEGDNPPEEDGEYKVEVEINMEEREKWGKKVEFFLACIGYAVGLGNVWRFPYLCFENGGGAFLIPYVCMLFLCGMPLFFMELALGQYVSLGPVTSWAAICPLAKGVGFSMLVVSFLCCVYYNVIIAWCLYYMFKSFASMVPWANCNNWWNTPNCARAKKTSRVTENGGVPSNTTGNNTELLYTTSCINQTFPEVGNLTGGNMTVMNASMPMLKCLNTTLNATANATATVTKVSAVDSNSPSKEFWENYVLRITDDMGDLGSMRVELLVALIVAWILVYFCLWKGIKSSGKVVYFTATFPYVVLVILLIRGVTLPGASKGIEFYLKPDFKKLADASVWATAATQIFYSLGIGFGSLITMGSFNQFHNNCFRDAMIVSVINCSTSVFAGFVIFSVLGFMAHVSGKAVKDVATSGPGLAFVVYPEGIAQMPISPFWAVLFFFMLLTLGLDTQFAMFEAVVTGLVDEYPRFLKKRKELFIAFLCFLCFLLGIPMVMQGGMYILNLYNYQSGGVSLLFLALFEVLTVSWGYGADRFAKDIENMIGYKIWRWWPIAWKFLTPLVILGVFLFSVIQWSGVKYGDYQYPPWAEFCGWVLALASMLWIPGVATYKLIKTPGSSLYQRICFLLRPDEEEMKAIELREGLATQGEMETL